MSTQQVAQTPVRRPLVAVIGDAKFPPGSSNEQLAEDVGRQLVDAGYRVLTGGLGGVMEAACRGARSSHRYQSGDTIGLVPGYDPGEANAFVDIALATGLDHVRNSIVAQADAVVAIGGGAGTLSEICFAWIYKRLVIALRTDGWSGRVADQPLDHRPRYPNRPQDRIFGASTAEEVMQILGAELGSYSGRHHGIRRRPEPPDPSE